ncbi:histone transcription regulator [Tubulinosema ratisbonensis]|uniref:Histone transcription regulator n=1 Tax=Tubulinosema ratisbonensis TaxID=291195 RepID=A0A437AM65_9MICR|nr:histone transcription regulator [Tubulinosema ratisbonensis]
MKITNLPYQHGKKRPAPIFSLDYHKHLTTGGGDGIMIIWSDPPQFYPDNLSPILCVRYDESGEYLATGHDDGSILVYKRRKEEEKSEVIDLTKLIKYKRKDNNPNYNPNTNPSHNPNTNYNPNATTLTSSTEEYKLFKKIKIHKSNVTSLSFHNNKLISVSYLGLVVINEINSFDLVKVMKYDLIITGLLVNCESIIIKGNTKEMNISKDNRTKDIKNNITMFIYWDSIKEYNNKEIREYFFDRMSMTSDNKFIAIGNSNSISNEDSINIYYNNNIINLIGHVAPSEVVSFNPNIFTINTNSKNNSNISKTNDNNITKTNNDKILDNNISNNLYDNSSNFYEELTNQLNEEKVKNISFKNVWDDSFTDKYYLLAISSQDRSLSLWSSLTDKPFLLLKGLSDSPVLDMKWNNSDLYLCTYSGKVILLSFDELFIKEKKIKKECNSECITNRNIIKDMSNINNRDDINLKNDNIIKNDIIKDESTIIKDDNIINNSNILKDNNVKNESIINNRNNEKINFELIYDKKNYKIFYKENTVKILKKNKNYLTFLTNKINNVKKYKNNLLLLSDRIFYLVKLKEKKILKDTLFSGKIFLKNGLMIIRNKVKYVYDENMCIFREIEKNDYQFMSVKEILRRKKK